MEEQIRFILKSLGEDPEREGLVRTPERMFFFDVKAGREIPQEMLYVPPQHRQ